MKNTSDMGCLTCNYDQQGIADFWQSIMDNRSNALTFIDPRMCHGHGVHVKAVSKYGALGLPIFLEQTEYFKPKVGLTPQSHMPSNGNQRTRPGRQGGLVRNPCEERMAQSQKGGGRSTSFSFVLSALLAYVFLKFLPSQYIQKYMMTPHPTEAFVQLLPKWSKPLWK